MNQDDFSSSFLSFVIPVLNEEESLAELYSQIKDALGTQTRYEILFIDDGSTDRSWAEVQALREQDQHVGGVRLRRNFGKATALAVGFARVAGDVIFTLDADLQDNPQEIPRFLARLAEGYDVVSGWKEKRRDPWHKTLPSWLFNAVVSRVSGVSLHDHNCGFKAYRRAVVGELELYGELHRYTPVLAAARGFRITEIPVHHRPRKFGRSKYGLQRFIRGFLDLLTVKLLTDYRQRPLHLFGVAGVVFLLLGGGGLGYLVGVWLYQATMGSGEPIGGRPLLAYSATAVLFGAQLLTLGLLAELVIASHFRLARAASIAEESLPSA